MKAIIFFLSVYISFSLPLLADNGEFAVSRIPAPLLKNADVIKRMESLGFEIINTGEAMLRKKYALTILNENGDRHAAFVEYYDKLHTVKKC
jgi:hypothetical protein